MLCPCLPVEQQNEAIEQVLEARGEIDAMPVKDSDKCFASRLLGGNKRCHSRRCSKVGHETAALSQRNTRNETSEASPTRPHTSTRSSAAATSARGEHTDEAIDGAITRGWGRCRHRRNDTQGLWVQIPVTVPGVLENQPITTILL